jgi:phospholipid transport system transporter-binding protein
VSKLSLTDEGNGLFSLAGNLTFATIDKQSLKSFGFLTSHKQIMIDLSHVGSTDSAGLALMIEWIKISRQHKTQLQFQNIPQQLKQLAQLSGLDETSVLPFHSHPH